MKSGLEPLGEAVRQELGRFRPAAAMTAIVGAWPCAVGAEIAANAWPARLGRDGALSVAVRSSPWAFELTQLEGTIRARLRECLGATAPARLRFAVGPLPERGAEAASAPAGTGAVIPPRFRLEGERLARGISDPELRALVARAAAASLAGGARNRSL